MIPNPEKENMKSFIPRPEVFKIIEDMERRDMFPFIVGEAGSGKTTFVEYYAMIKQRPFLDISADVGLSARELLGSLQIRTTASGGTESFFNEGLFARMTQIDAVILIDEVTALDPAKTFLFHQILASRRFFSKDAKEEDGSEGKRYDLNPDCLICFAGNPPWYAGTQPLNLAFQDRLATVILDPLSQKDLMRLLTGKRGKEKFPNLTPKMVDSIIKMFFDVKNFIEKSEGKIRAIISNRGVEKIAALISDGYDPFNAVQLGFLNAVRSSNKKEADWKGLEDVIQLTFKK